MPVKDNPIHFFLAFYTLDIIINPGFPTMPKSLGVIFKSQRFKNIQTIVSVFLLLSISSFVNFKITRKFFGGGKERINLKIKIL